MGEPSPGKRKAPSDAAPLMKRQAKAAMPSQAKAPVSKAPIAKTAPITKTPPATPPVGKAPITKAPVAKRPPIAQPAASPSAGDADAFAKKPPAVPPKSPSPDGSASPSDGQPSLTGTWRDFEESDPLYALLGEMQETKVTSSDGAIDEAKLHYYVEKGMRPDVAKPKNWIEIWAAMDIPVDIPNHALVVRTIIQIGVASECGDSIGEVLAELVKGHRAKVAAVVEAIITLFEYGCDEKDCLVRFLLFIFPKSPTSSWGWARTGWSWREWWSIADKIFSTLEKSAAFEALRNLLSTIENDSGTYLPHQQIWDEKRLSIVRAALCRFGGLKEDELSAAVDISLA